MSLAFRVADRVRALGFDGMLRTLDVRLEPWQHDVLWEMVTVLVNGERRADGHRAFMALFGRDVIRV